nr:MAG TPA: hypothetical protein [Caudoviricetes sp.]
MMLSHTARLTKGASPLPLSRPAHAPAAEHIKKTFTQKY